MVRDVFFSSNGVGQIRVRRWEPDTAPKGVVQIVHGIAEHVERYDDVAQHLNRLGYLVIAEDHMGHGKSINGDGIKGYFHGGWFRAVEDTYDLLKQTKAEFQNIPYFLYGHSMGSFIVRTILIDHPHTQITGCIICGTGWIPKIVLKSGLIACKLVCRLKGETAYSEALQKLVFAGYNNKIEHPRTAYDWLTRDHSVVDTYIADPMCGFTVTAGLLRDMLTGISYIQDMQNLANMNAKLPIYFIAGGNDPVGQYGNGVLLAKDAFEQRGMTDVDFKIYPLCRHEIHNEINKAEVLDDIGTWLNHNV